MTRSISPGGLRTQSIWHGLFRPMYVMLKSSTASQHIVCQSLLNCKATLQMHFVPVLFASLFVAALPLVATSIAEDRVHPGLKVGQEAPSFSLKDQQGGEVKLEDLIKDRPVALVFHRSASW